MRPVPMQAMFIVLLGAEAPNTEDGTKYADEKRPPTVCRALRRFTIGWLVIFAERVLLQVLRKAKIFCRHRASLFATLIGVTNQALVKETHKKN